MRRQRILFFTTIIPVLVSFSHGFSVVLKANVKEVKSDFRMRYSLGKKNSKLLLSRVPDEKSLMATLNDLGQSFKSRAQQTTAKVYQAEKRSKKVLYSLQACCYYFLFMIYRGYRGFFVILPAVFREVYAKLRRAMDYDLEMQDEKTERQNETGRVQWRTRITVAIIASIVTFSFVLGGFLRVVTSFFRTIALTSSFPASFEAATEELLESEQRIDRIAKKNYTKSFREASDSSASTNASP